MGSCQPLLTRRAMGGVLVRPLHRLRPGVLLLAVCLLLQLLTATAMLVLAMALAVGILGCGTKRELRQAGWPDR